MTPNRAANALQRWILPSKPEDPEGHRSQTAIGPSRFEKQASLGVLKAMSSATRSGPPA